MDEKEKMTLAVNITAILLSFVILVALITASLMENTFAEALHKERISTTSTITDPVDIKLEGEKNGE
jgi:hypothetical protein